ncbi:hypothetical protein [Scatolibacter rhodanostii]|uniref:hypothetical protein n=1 Tax=Scatolibacter rhodanostii TaxID=2014781 RepID=UPI000C08AC38|nr:hypothetical protein [Scatolibacter rhodanostii]
MTLTIEIKDCERYGLTPSYVYKLLCKEICAKTATKYRIPEWGLFDSCDYAARGAYSQITGRRANVTHLVLTHSDAESCSELFRQFAETWALNMSLRHK